MSVQQQSNTTDCGIFAIAIATDLRYGNSASNVSYEHENTCAKANKRKRFTYNLDAYCTCRDVYFEEDIEKDKSYFMAQCCSYDDWFHRKCLC